MRVVTVGTGTVVPDPERASACFWVERGPTRAVIDCGAGGLQGLARAGLGWDRISHLLISHFHADHIAEIPALIFALRHALPTPRSEPLAVVGPVGTRDLFEAWAGAYGDWIVEPGFPLEIEEVTPAAATDIGVLELRVSDTPHTDESLAMRLAADGGATLGYTGDTGPSDELGVFLEGVDLLIAECSLPDDLVGDNHLSPGRLGRLAARASPKRLAVTHVYPQLRGVDVPGLIRKAGYAGEIVMARDGLELSL